MPFVRGRMLQGAKMRKMQEAQGLDQLIEAGSSGYFPLFYQDWIHESFADVTESKRMSFSRAAEMFTRSTSKLNVIVQLKERRPPFRPLRMMREKSSFFLS